MKPPAITTQDVSFRESASAVSEHTAGSRSEERRTKYDVAIIGQGPAGMTAGLYAARAGLSVVTFERMGPGGQMTGSEHLDNYPGFTQGVGPFELAFAMNDQAARFGAETVNEEVARLDLDTVPKRIVLASGKVYEAETIILAMGAEPRPLGLENELKLRGRGVSYCATCDGGFFRGKTAVVVGGGNTAVMDAVYLSRLCKEVHLVHRRDTLRADAVNVDELEGIGNLSTHFNCIVTELHEEDGRVSGVRVRNMRAGEEYDIETSALFVAIGIRPKSSLLENAGLALDDYGYVVADESGVTNIPGVFVAGDLRTKQLRQVVTAASDGANAATSAFEFLCLRGKAS